MDYQFFMRDSEGQSYLAATASVSGSPDGNIAADWSGPRAAQMKEWLEELGAFMMLGGDFKFNTSNVEHWRKLPEIVSGQRLWVVVVEPSG